MRITKREIKAMIKGLIEEAVNAKVYDHTENKTYSYTITSPDGYAHVYFYDTKLDPNNLTTEDIIDYLTAEDRWYVASSDEIRFQEEVREKDGFRKRTIFSIDVDETNSEMKNEFYDPDFNEREFISKYVNKHFG
jgi:hypothetical protein